MINSTLQNRLSFILMLFISIGLTSFYGCQKEKNDNTQLIIGKWKGVNEQWEDYTNGKLTDSGSGAADHDLFLIFKTDGKVVEENFEVPSSPIITTYNYTLTGNNLKISNNADFNIEFTITELSKTSLNLRSEETNTSNGVTYKSIRKINFSRIDQ